MSNFEPHQHGARIFVRWEYTVKKKHI